MREQQIKIARNIERLEKIRFKHGAVAQIDVDRATYLVLTNEIQLLQAKQLLQLKQQADNSKTK